jgi:hypothetical protein
MPGELIDGRGGVRALLPSSGGGEDSRVGDERSIGEVVPAFRSGVTVLLPLLLLSPLTAASLSQPLPLPLAFGVLALQEADAEVLAAARSSASPRR